MVNGRNYLILTLSPTTTRLAQISNSTGSDDDLIFYVTRKTQDDFQHPSYLVEVFRHHDKKTSTNISITRV